MNSLDYMLQTPRPELGNTSPDSNPPDHELRGSQNTSNQCDFEDSCYDPERPYYNSSDIQIILNRTTPYANFDQKHMPSDQGFNTTGEKHTVLSSADENYMEKEMEKELNRITGLSSSTSESSYSDKVLNEILMGAGIINPQDTNFSNVVENSEHKSDGQKKEIEESLATRNKILKPKIRYQRRKLKRAAARRGDNRTYLTMNKIEIVKNNTESETLSKSAKRRMRDKKIRVANETQIAESRGEIIKYFDNDIETLPKSVSTGVCDEEKGTTRVCESGLKTNTTIDVEQTKNVYMKQRHLNKVHELLCPQVQLNEIDLLQAMIEHLENCNK